MNARSQRLSMVAGIVFVILFVVGLNMTFGAQPDLSDISDPGEAGSKVLAAAADSGKRHVVIIGSYLLVVSAMALLWFVVGLRARIAAAVGRESLVPALVGAFGTAAALSVLFGGATGALLPGTISLGGEPVPADGDAARLIAELGIPFLMIAFGVTVACFIVVVSVVALAGVAVPRWLGYAGFVAAIAGLLAVMFLPLFVVMLWFLAVAIVGLRDRSHARTSSAAAAPAPA
jgi:hypothetical protein